MDSTHPTPPLDQDWWQRLLRRTRAVAERIEGRILGVMNRHALGGADGEAGPEGTEGGTPHADGG